MLADKLSRFWRLSALLAAVCLVFAGPVRASCLPVLDFGQLASACNAGSSYCYVISPGVNTPGSIVSSFWSLQGGNPVVGIGIDNGSWQSPQAWLNSGALGNWLAGSWSAAGIDGCINGRIPAGKSSEIMVAGFSDADVFGTHGYFAVAAVARHVTHFPQFDFAGDVGAHLELKPIPRTSFFTFARTSPVAWRAFVNSPSVAALAGGYYTDGSTSFQESVTGYRIYKRDQYNPPADRHRATWTPVTGVVPLGQQASFDYQCLGQSSTYFATSLVFDGGFETGYVSSNSLPIRLCSDCWDDLDGDGWSDGEICGHADCNDDDFTVFPGAPEVNDGRDNQCPGSFGFGLIDEISENAGFYHPGDATRFTWLVEDGATQYEVARSALRDFAEDCLMTTTSLPSLGDPDVPQPGSLFYYLVRPTVLFVGSWGRLSSGLERAIDCN